MMVNNSRKRAGRVNFADGFSQDQFDNSCDTEETPNESAISDQEDDGEFDDNALSEESNVNVSRIKKK